MNAARVAVLMGSDSDWEVMQHCVEQLRALGLSPQVRVMSAHRTPDDVAEFARGAQQAGFGVLIAAAGMSAALAGVLAAHTTLPIIGVPLNSGPLQGFDALLSTVQMPPGVPVATVAVGTAGARNAAVLAAQILALGDADVARRLEKFKRDQADAVRARDQALQKKV